MARIHPSQQVFAYVYGNTVEMTSATGNVAPVKKIDSDRYMTHDGEIKFYNKSENRSENLVSIKRTLKKLRRIICENFSGGEDELWITLTYAENVQDSKVVYSDFRNLLKKLKRKYGKLEYVNVLEPQKRGAWHMHLLLKSDDGRYLRIENADLQKLWGKGFVKVKRLKHSDNVAAYLMAYLSDIELDENENGKQHVELKNGKRVEKGGRLNMYPSGMNFYRTSKGIIKPQGVKTSKDTILDTVGLNKSEYERPAYETHFSVEKSDGTQYNIDTEFFNFNRGDKE